PGGHVLVTAIEWRRLHARQVSCAGWPADVRSGKAMASHVAFRGSSARPGKAAARVSWRFEVLVEFSAHSRREDVVRSGGNAEGSPVFAFFMMVCVVFLDTLTPVFDLYVRLRERQQWDIDFPEFVFSRLDPRGARHGPAGVVLVGLHSCLTCSPGAADGPFVRDCETERLFLCCVVRSTFDPFEVCPGVGTVVTTAVACGGTVLVMVVSVLVPCGSRASFWLAVLLPMYLRLACEAYSLGSDLLVRLIA
ncbi:hypothetical protein Taro_031734, partial [Colocasia esculenta]|nr:hypothetical protein [Colocasia esculenta]